MVLRVFFWMAPRSACSNSILFVASTSVLFPFLPRSLSSRGVGKELHVHLCVCYSPPLGWVTMLRRMEGRSWAPGVAVLPIFYLPYLLLHVSLLLRSPFSYSSAMHLPQFVYAMCKGCVASPHLLTLQHSHGWWDVNVIPSLRLGWYVSVGINLS